MKSLLLLSRMRWLFNLLFVLWNLGLLHLPLKPLEDILSTWRKAGWNQQLECLSALIPSPSFQSLWWLSYPYLQVMQGNMQLTQTKMTSQNKLNKSCYFTFLSLWDFLEGAKVTLCQLVPLLRSDLAVFSVQFSRPFCCFSLGCTKICLLPWQIFVSVSV